MLINGRLDLHDQAAFFSSGIPNLARYHEVLKYATTAVAAKQLGRVGGVRTLDGAGLCRAPASTETYPNSVDVDWSYKAANYYQQALTQLHRLFARQDRSLGESSEETRALGTSSRDPSAQPAGDNPSTAGCSTSDLILAAVSILRLNDCLDSGGGDCSQ